MSWTIRRAGNSMSRAMESARQQTILVVDDDPVITDLMVRRLKADGFEAEGVLNSTDARARLENGNQPEGAVRPVDLILLDIEMPDISGLDFLAEIRRSRSAIELPVIMVTGRDSAEDVVQALGQAANDYVTKPVDFPVLNARIRTHLALKELHEQVRHSHRSLIHAAKMESVVHLAGGFAHEIRRPLAQVRLGFSNLKQAVSEGGDPAELFDSVEDSLKAVDQVVSELIASSTPNRLQLKPVDLVSFVEQMRGVLSEASAIAGTPFELKLENTRPVALMAVEEMRQVFVNIALNAIQASEPGGKIIIRIGERKVGEEQVELKSSRIGPQLHPGDTAAAFEIEDSGPGLTPEELERVFDPFYKGARSGPGAGLGLTVARQLVDLHGGRITVENKAFGKGAKVTVMLRLKPPVVM